MTPGCGNRKRLRRLRLQTESGTERSKAFVLESGKCRKVHVRMGKDQTQHGAGDHTDEHEGGHIVTGLHHKPHGKHGCQENVGEGDVDPHVFAEDYRQIHSAYKGENGEIPGPGQVLSIRSV